MFHLVSRSYILSIIEYNSDTAIMLFLRLMRFKTILLHPACLQTVLTSPVVWFLGFDTALILLTLYIFSIQCISSYLLSVLTI